MTNFAAIVLLAPVLTCFAAPQRDGRKIPANMYPVKPISASAAAPSANLTVARGQFFSYALPQTWRVGEDGQFALTLVAPDNKALTVMVGNAGNPPNYPPAQFVYQKLMAMRPQDLRAVRGQLHSRRCRLARRRQVQRRPRLRFRDYGYDRGAFRIRPLARLCLLAPHGRRPDLRV